MSSVVDEIEALIMPIVTNMGYEWIGCEYHAHVLRLYIDRDSGVTLDDCAKVSRQVGAVLDVEDPILSRYCLEVSSPGLERPLFKIDHFKQYVGHKVKVRLCAPLEGSRSLTGVIIGVKDGQVVLKTIDEVEQHVVFEEILKAHLVAEGSVH